MKDEQGFAVNLAGLQNWGIKAARSKDLWRTSQLPLRRIGDFLVRREEAIPASYRDGVSLATIRFDGTIERRDTVPRHDIQGRLFRIYPGDLVYSKIDARNGALGFIPLDVHGLSATSEFPIYSLRNGDFDINYARLISRSPQFLQSLQLISSGSSGRKRIAPEDFEDLLVPLPDVDVQQDIVREWIEAADVTRARRRALRDFISLLSQTLEEGHNTSALAQHKAVLTPQVSRMRSWDYKSGRVAEFEQDNPRAKSLDSLITEQLHPVVPQAGMSGVPVYGVSNRRGVFLSAMRDASWFSTPYREIREGWFFHNPTRANVGSVGRVPKVEPGAMTSPEYQVWSAIDPDDAPFLDAFIRTRFFLQLVDVYRVGAVKERMYYANLAAMRVILPPVDERRALGQELRLHTDAIQIAESEEGERLDRARARLVPNPV